MKDSKAGIRHGALAAHAASLGDGNAPRRPVPAPVKEALLRDLIGTGKAPAIRVSGNSMLPTLIDGDIVVVGPCRGRVEIGAILVFFMKEVLLIHRVVWIDPGPSGRVLKTKGDFALELDPVCLKEEDALGRVVALRRCGLTIDLESPLLRALGRAAAAASFRTAHWVERIRGKTQS